MVATACVSVLTWLAQQKAPTWQLDLVSFYWIPHNPEVKLDLIFLMATSKDIKLDAGIEFS